MALALLNISRDKVIASDRRVIKRADVQVLRALNDCLLDTKSLLAEQKAQLDASSDVALEIAKLQLADESTRTLAEQMLAASKQMHDFEKKLVANFVPTVMEALRAVLGDSPPKEFYATVLARATQMSAEGVSVSLHVSPFDADQADAAVLRYREDVNQVRVELVKDATVRPGACWLKTPVGKLDLSLEIQLAALESSLHRWVAGETVGA
jgi:flagellar biosynthesis/type III secretory pathway protein FliH